MSKLDWNRRTPLRPEREHRPTQKQLELLAKLGVTVPPETKGEAHDLIEQLLEQQKDSPGALSQKPGGK